MTAIPYNIIRSAPGTDFTRPKRGFGVVCNYCAQSSGSHYYACPALTDENEFDRLSRSIKETPPLNHYFEVVNEK